MASNVFVTTAVRAVTGFLPVKSLVSYDRVEYNKRKENNEISSERSREGGFNTCI